MDATKYYPSRCVPTIQNSPNFNAGHDAEALRKAMKGMGTDEQAIIDLLTNRGIVQRLEIMDTYKTMFGKDLLSDLKSELSGKLEEVIVALMTPLPAYYAQQLHRALSGIGTDDEALIEVLCTLSNYGIRTVASYYSKMFGKELEKDLKGDTTGHYRRLCVSLAMGNRNEDSNVDESLVKKDAIALHQAGEKKWGTDESVFNAILVSRSYQHLRKLFAEYEKLAGKDIETSIKTEFSGDIRTALLALVSCIRSKANFFAERLYKSMKGVGTDDKTLIRIIVSRSEIDLGDIKEAFAKQYGESLQSWIKKDTSGDYGKVLLQIVK